VIEDIFLLPGVRAVEAFDDPPDVLLFPEEQELIAKAVDKRRREFSTARNCARTALAGLGLPPVAIVHGERGSPVWPAGVVGSITHCAGYRASAVALASEVLTIGLDAEPNDVLPDGVLNVISTEAERAWLPEVTSLMPAVCWDRLLFSAKESVYKAWFPLTRKWLGFDDATLTVEPAAGTFTAQLLVPGPIRHDVQITHFRGRWLVGNGLVVTAIEVPA
jgi:4'-phosphopantetheinyl transferase EntD